MFDAKVKIDPLYKAADQAGRKVRDLLDTAGDEITYAKGKLSRKIRANPLRSSLIALGIGTVLGALLRR